MSDYTIPQASACVRWSKANLGASRARSRLLAFLDRCRVTMERGCSTTREPLVDPAVRLMAGYREALGPEEWRSAIREIREHPTIRYFYEDPYTAHGFHKPRGYPGDAVLLDFIYGGGTSSPFVERASALGKAIYYECNAHPSSRAIRSRRDYLGHRVVSLCRNGRRPEILSVACGHLREADAFRLATGAGHPGRYVAMDQDPATLEVALSEYSELALEPYRGSVLSLLRPGNPLDTFDLIYTAGLYDYLSAEVALRLTAKLATLLKPRGRLLIANMLPELPGAGYMEAVMDWWLVYRSLSEIKDLSRGLGPGYRVTTRRRPFVGYLEIENGESK
jgi:extracellular factor (EF) 3-hydroxypalmitic acid methyl ester biosynthesis protein